MTARDFGAVSGIRVECLLRRRGLVDERLQRIDGRIDRAVEHHRAHSIRKEFRVLRAEQRAVGKAHVIQLVVAERLPEPVHVLGHRLGYDSHRFGTSERTLLRGLWSDPGGFGTKSSRNWSGV